MIIYNITTLVSWSVHDEWKNWMKETYVPALIATGFFTRYQLVRLLEVNDDEGVTYALQLYLQNETNFRAYREKHLDQFQLLEKNMWGDNACSFSSLMEVIN